MIDTVWQRADDFDIIHFHLDYSHFLLFKLIAGRTIATLHGWQDIPDLLPVYLRFCSMPLVSISNSQRAPVKQANFIRTVPHGLPLNLHRPTFDPRGGYLAFLGRISPEKRPDRAIAIDRACRLPLKIAAKVDKVDEDYFREVVCPLLAKPGVEYIGEINERRKRNFSAKPRHCLFQSIGRSRSGWSWSKPWLVERPFSRSAVAQFRRSLTKAPHRAPPHSCVITRRWRFARRGRALRG